MPVTTEELDKPTTGLTVRDVDGGLRDAWVAARLHMALVGHGPVGRLGAGFLARFCYSKLVREGLLRVAVAEVDGHAAGFVAYTPLAMTFHRFALRRYPLHAAVALTYSLTLEPRRITGITKALHLMVSRRREEKLISSDPTAEIMAFGVLPQYRDRAFVRDTGIQTSQTLMGWALSYFRDLGLEEVRAVVEATNRETLIFYRLMGATLEPWSQAGEPSKLVLLPLGPE